MGRVVRRGGATAALTVLGATQTLLCRALVVQWRIVTSPGPASLDEALTLAVVVVSVALSGWLVVSTVAALLAHLPGRLGAAADRWTRTWAPAWSRRVAAVLVGAAVGGALAPGTALGDSSAPPVATSPAFAATAPRAGIQPASDPASDPASAPSPGPGFSLTIPTTPRGPSPTPSPRSTSDASAPGWLPSRPVQRPQPSPGLVTGTTGSRAIKDAKGTRSTKSTADLRTPHAAVVVHRGDTLWDIARRHLGPDASDAEVAHAWPAWYEANRAVIGADPDAILPGQILHPPSPTDVSTATTVPTGPTVPTAPTGPTVPSVPTVPTGPTPGQPFGPGR